MDLGIKIRVTSLEISDGKNIELGEDDALIIVGPNNSGKSQFLRDIDFLAKLHYGSVYNGKVVVSLKLSAPENSEIMQKLQRFRVNETDYYLVNGFRTHQNNVHNAFVEGMNGHFFGQAGNFFIKLVSSDDRLSVVAPSPALTEEGAQTPGQLLYDDEDLIGRVSALFLRAFNKELFLDYRSGSTIPFYVGNKPPIPAGSDRISNDYVKLVRACDKLHEQGDGMKSFAGIVLSTLVSKFNITLIDEPEAFLHPPQERIIARVIAQETKGQVICSTHSTNFLQGFLESGRENVRVLRITRNENLNHIKEISNSEIGTLWKDPVFRYSTALNALFHDRAVLCEAEPDCRFYEAIENHLFSDAALDSHYIPCAGKAAFPKFSKALRKLGVPVVAILDIDVLNNETTLKAIYEAQGGEWSTIESLWKKIDSAVRSGIKVDDLDTIKTRIGVLLDGWHNGSAPVSQIVEALNQRKPWGVIKEQGLNGFPSGEVQGALEALMIKLSEFSIFPAPVGTLEKFVKTIGNHGNKWLSQVLEKYSLDDSKLEEARKFVRFALSKTAGS